MWVTFGVFHDICPSNDIHSLEPMKYTEPCRNDYTSTESFDDLKSKEVKKLDEIKYKQIVRAAEQVESVPKQKMFMCPVSPMTCARWLVVVFSRFYSLNHMKFAWYLCAHSKNQ